jgi:hypothetical protein
MHLRGEVYAIDFISRTLDSRNARQFQFPSCRGARPLASLETRTMPVQSTQVREVTGPEIMRVSRLAKGRAPRHEEVG